MDLLISSGVSSYPSGLSDESVSLVLPLYNGLNLLARQVAEATGNVRYTQAELLSLDPFAGVKTGSTSKVSAVAGEAIGYGDIVTFTPSGSDLVAFKASYDSPSKPARGVCDTVGGLTIGTRAQFVFMQGRTRGISGSVFSVPYYLGLNGGVTAIMPSGPSDLKQIVGMGLGVHGFYVQISVTF